MENVQKFIRTWERRKHKKWLNTIFNDYSNYLLSSSKKDISKAWDLKHIIPYLYFLEDNHLNKITTQNISDYIEEQSTKFSIRTVYNRKVTLKLFLDWLYSNNIIDFDGKTLFSSIPTVKGASITSYYTNNEIQTIINNMPNNTSKEKRDFVIVLLFAYTGMRLEDVRTLTLDSIDWNNNLIKFIQSKNSSEIIITMPKDLRLALIDYLKNSRYDSNSNYVFVNKGNKLFSSDYFTSVVSFAITDAAIEIDGRKHGCHTFRHSLATNMLNNNELLSTIIKILGHIYHKSVSDDYIKYDEIILKNISLEVPLWK